MRHRLRKTLILFVLFCLFILVWLMNPIVKSSSGEALQVSAEKLKSHVLTLVGKPPFRSSVTWSQMDVAADYVKAQWMEMGFHVEEQVFDVHGKKARNLIVTYLSPGVKADAPRVIIGAHYDVCMNLPGADDNASGVAGLLELSRLIKEKKPVLQHRLDLIAYALEEPPYYDTDWMGSYVHAKAMREQNVTIDLMLSLEMIGYFTDEKNSQNFPISMLKASYPTVGNFVALVGSNSEWSEVRKVKSSMQAMTGLPIYSINTFSLIEGVDWSDHRSYWNFGYPALMLTDTSFLRNRNYHKESDTPETLDYSRMAEVVKATYGAVIAF